MRRQRGTGTRRREHPFAARRFDPSGHHRAGAPSRWRARSGPDERGNALAEFALVLPLLMMLVFGMIEMGFALSAAQSIEAAAREGGRLASLQSTTTAEVVDRVDQALVGVPLQSGPVVSVAPGGCAGREGQPVTVTVTGWQQLSIPFVVDRQVELSSEAVFRCEA